MDPSRPDRPVLHALVGEYVDPFGLIGDGQYVTLSEAVEYQRLGFWVLVDPQDEAELTRWEQGERAKTLFRRNLR